MVRDPNYQMSMMRDLAQLAMWSLIGHNSVMRDLLFSQSVTHDFSLKFPSRIAREDKGDREGIPHTHPIPLVIRLELFLESG